MSSLAGRAVVARLLGKPLRQVRFEPAEVVTSATKRHMPIGTDEILR